MSSNNYGGLTGLPILENAGGSEQINVTSAAVVSLLVPDYAVSCSIVVSDVLAPTLPCVRFYFGANPSTTAGNPLYDKMYFELTTPEAMTSIRFRGVDANTKVLNVQYYR
jgi:hypothetical protein